MDAVSRATAGLRRLSRGHLALTTHVQAYDGLPDGVTKIELLQKLKAAAPRLGLRASLLMFIEQLIMVTSECDWMPGRHPPIAWPSNDDLMARLGLKRTAVQNLTRQAQRLGLVMMQDSESGRRTGKRDARGRILYAFGFNLAPLAARYGEFCDHAEAVFQERQESKRHRKAISVDKREVRRVAADAIGRSYDGFDWPKALAEAQACDMRSLTLTDLRILADRASGLRQAVDKAWKDAAQADDKEPWGSVPGALYLPTTDLMIGSTYQDPRGIVVPDRPVLDMDTALEAETRASGESIRLELVLDAIPEVHAYLPGEPGEARWTDLHTAAEVARYDLGIHPTLWAKAVRTLGANNASAAIAYTLANQADGRITSSPGGFYQALIERATTGQLHLRDSLWGKLGRPKCAAAKESHLARRRANGAVLS